MQFLWDLNEENNPRYAGVRGTNASRYMCDAYGSDKAFSFKLKAVIPNNEVHIFESAIDLLSYATIKEMKNENGWKKIYYLQQEFIKLQKV